MGGSLCEGTARACGSLRNLAPTCPAWPPPPPRRKVGRGAPLRSARDGWPLRYRWWRLSAAQAQVGRWGLGPRFPPLSQGLAIRP